MQQVQYEDSYAWKTSTIFICPIEAQMKHQALLLLFAAAATCCHHTRWPARILMREKITKYLFFPLKLKWNTKLFLVLFTAVAIWCNQSRRPAADAAGRRVWLNQIAAAVNKSNKAWCFTSASLGNINILLFFDAPMVEAPYTACCFCSYCCWFSAFSSNSSGCCCLLWGATKFDWIGPGKQS